MALKELSSDIKANNPKMKKSLGSNRGINVRLCSHNEPEKYVTQNKQRRAEHKNKQTGGKLIYNNLALRACELFSYFIKKLGHKGLRSAEIGQ